MKIANDELVDHFNALTTLAGRRLGKDIGLVVFGCMLAMRSAAENYTKDQALIDAAFATATEHAAADATALQEAAKIRDECLQELLKREVEIPDLGTPLNPELLIAKDVEPIYCIRLRLLCSPLQPITPAPAQG